MRGVPAGGGIAGQPRYRTVARPVGRVDLGRHDHERHVAGIGHPGDDLERLGHPTARQIVSDGPEPRHPVIPHRAGRLRTVGERGPGKRRQAAWPVVAGEHDQHVGGELERGAGELHQIVGLLVDHREVEDLVDAGPVCGVQVLAQHGRWRQRGRIEPAGGGGLAEQDHTQRQQRALRGEPLVGRPPVARRGAVVTNEHGLGVVRLRFPDPDGARRVAQIARGDRLGHLLGGWLGRGVFGARCAHEIEERRGLEALGRDEPASQRVTRLASPVAAGSHRATPLRRTCTARR